MPAPQEPQQQPPMEMSTTDGVVTQQPVSELNSFDEPNENLSPVTYKDKLTAPRLLLRWRNLNPT